MTTKDSQREGAHAEILELFQLRTELQKRARRILAKITQIEETICKIDAQRVRPL